MSEETNDFEQELDPSLFEDDEIIDDEYDDHALDEDDLEEWDEDEEE